MSERTISILLQLEDKEYKDALENLMAKMKVFRTELDVTTSSFLGQEKTMQALSEKNVVLAKEIENLNQRINLEKDAIERGTAAKNDAINAIEQYRKQIADSQKAIEDEKKTMAERSAEMAKVREKLNELNAKEQEAQKVVDDLNKKYHESATHLPEFKKKLKETEEAVKTSAERQKEAQKALDDLNEKYKGGSRNFPWFKERLKAATQEVEDATREHREAEKALEALNTTYVGAIANFPWFKQKLAEATKGVEEATVGKKELEEELTRLVKEYLRSEEAIRAYNAAIAEGNTEIEALQTLLSNRIDPFLRKHEIQLNQNTAQLNRVSHEMSENEKAMARWAEAGVTSEEEFKALATQVGVVAAGVKEYIDVLNECIRVYAQLESAMTGVAKTTDLSDEELRVLREDFMAMSTMMPIAASDLARIAELGGQLGISNAGLEKFAETIARIKVSTDLEIDEAATAFAQFANIVGLTENQYERLGSTIVGLGNNFATGEKMIMQMSQRFASAGVSAGLSAQEITAFSAAAGSLGFAADAGGSALTKLVEKVKEMVDSGDEGVLTMAALANVTAEDFVRVFQEDAAGAIAMFLNGLGQTGTEMSSLASELGFNEIRVKRLVTSLAAAEAQNGLLSRTLEEANTAWAMNNALQEEAAKFNETLESKTTMLNNALDNLKSIVGLSLAPVVKGALTIGTEAISAVNWLLTNVPGLTVVLDVLATGIAGLAIFSLPKIFSPLQTLIGQFVNVGSAMKETAVTGINALKSMSAESLNFLGMASAATIAAVALAKVYQKVYSDMKDGFKVDISGIKTSTEAQEKLNELTARRKEILDEVAKGRTLDYKTQAELQVLTETINELTSAHDNLLEVENEEANNDLAEAIQLKADRYAEYRQAVYENLTAVDYMLEEHASEYELTTEKIMENIQKQIEWQTNYSQNREKVLAMDIKGLEEWASTWDDGSDRAAELWNALANTVGDSEQEIREKIAELIRQYKLAESGARDMASGITATKAAADDAAAALEVLRAKLTGLNGMDVHVNLHFSDMTGRLPDNMYIQGHAQGLSYVPYDEYPAFLHEGEMVLSRAEARMYREMGNAIATRSGDNVNNSVVINVHGGNRQSPEEIANVIMTKIQQATERKSAVWA